MLGRTWRRVILGSTEAEALENIKDAIREYLAVVAEQLEQVEVREVEAAV